MGSRNEIFGNLFSVQCGIENKEGYFIKYILKYKLLVIIAFIKYNDIINS